MQKMEDGIVVQIIKQRLYWILSRQAPRHRQQSYCFNTDKIMFEMKKTIDLQVVSLSVLSKFINFVNEVLSNGRYQEKRIFYHSTYQQKYKLNSCFLICAYQILYLQKSIPQALQLFKNVQFINYGTNNIFQYTLQQALTSLYRATQLQYYSLKTKYIHKYQYYSLQNHGSIYQIIPNKLLVFQWPQFYVTSHLNKKNKFNISDYIKTFIQLSVTDIVKLQNTQKLNYKQSQFKKNGIKHQIITIYNSENLTNESIMKALDLICKQGKFALISQDSFSISMMLVALYILKTNRDMNLQQVIPWCKIMIPGCILAKHILFLKDRYQILVGRKIYRKTQQIIGNK